MKIVKKEEVMKEQKLTTRKRVARSGIVLLVLGAIALFMAILHSLGYLDARWANISILAWLATGVVLALLFLVAPGEVDLFTLTMIAIFASVFVVGTVHVLLLIWPLVVYVVAGVAAIILFLMFADWAQNKPM